MTNAGPWEIPPDLMEQQSSLVLFSEKFFHCNIIGETAMLQDPGQRFAGVMKWFFSTMYRKAKGAKLPGMAVEGEVFRCAFDNPAAAASPEYGRIFLVSEQVTAQTAALFASDRQSGWMLQGSITSERAFMGDSIQIAHDSALRLTLVAHNEQYLITFPNQVLSGLLSGIHMVELTGKASIKCAATGYRADMVFKDALCFRNHAGMNRVEGIVQHGGTQIGTVGGVWDAEVALHYAGGQDVVLLNNDSGFRKRRLRRRVVPLNQQHQLSPSGACDKFFDSELASKARNAAYARGNFGEGHKLSKELFAAAQKRKESVPAPAFFDVEEVDDVVAWSYKHADGRPWDSSTGDFYVFELEGVVQTLSKAEVKAKVEQTGGTLPAVAAGIAGLGGGGGGAGAAVLGGLGGLGGGGGGGGAMMMMGGGGGGGGMGEDLAEEIDERLSIMEKTLKGSEKENRALKDRIGRLENNERQFLHTYMPAFGLLFSILQYLVPTILRLLGLM